MRIKFYALLASILYSIYRVEDSMKGKSGVDKLSQVVKEAQMKAFKEGMLPSLSAEFSPQLLQMIIEAITLIVAILNEIGIFSHTEER